MFLRARPEDQVLEVEMFSRVEIGCAAVGRETACCRSDRCLDRPEGCAERKDGRIVEEEGVVVGGGLEDVEATPSRWFTVDRLGGAMTVVRRAISAGTGLVEKEGPALAILSAGMFVRARLRMREEGCRTSNAVSASRTVSLSPPYVQQEIAIIWYGVEKTRRCFNCNLKAGFDFDDGGGRKCSAR